MAAPAPAPTPAPASTEPPADAAELWDRVRASVAGSAMQSGLVELFELKSLRGDTAEIIITNPASAFHARSKVNWIGELLSKVSGRTMHARLVEGPAPAAREPSERSAGASLIAADAAARAEAMENPLVRKAIDLFNARVISVESDPETQPAQPPPS